MIKAPLRIACIQASPVVFDANATLAKAVALAERAAMLGARLVVFPEAFLSGYPKGLDFGARVGTRSPEGREDFRRYHESSVTVPGPETDALGELARRLQIHLVMGVIEREGGTLYCSVLFFAPGGSLMGKHRKVMPTALERLVWGMGDGSTLPVLDTTIGKLGAVICWENYMPLLRTAMYQRGIELYCAPTVDDRDTWLPTMRHIAVEGRCFVISSCQFLRRSDCPDDYRANSGDAPGTVLIRGGSCIVGPFGDVLAGPVFGEETVLTADIDRDDIVRGKYDLDVTGHYGRPDLFQLSVDERPKRSVIFVDPKG